MGRTTQFLVLYALTLYQGYFVASSFDPYVVEVIDANIDRLVVHVFSKDDDLGNRTMTVKEEFHWNFRMNFDESTKFHGEFMWMNDDNTVFRNASFPVFDRHVAKDCGQNLFKEHKCFWLVTDAGFYFSKDNVVASGWTFKYDWS